MRVLLYYLWIIGLFTGLINPLVGVYAASVSNLSIEIIPLPECNDHLDNDGDGLIDYPQDPDCASLSDRREAAGSQCYDGIDNDGDGLIDYPQDPDCSNQNDNSENPSNQGGGGGGGSGSSSPPGLIIKPVTSIRFSGYAYPLSKVSIFQDTYLALTTIAGPDAKFDVSLTDLASGYFTFSLRAEDEDGNFSPLFTFPVYITYGASTHVSGIFLAPTVSTDKKEVRKGETIVIFGKTVPQSKVVVSVSSQQETFRQVNSNKEGVYLLNLDTSFLEEGEHLAKAKAESQGIFSPWSNVVKFAVSDISIKRDSGVCEDRFGDLNCDGRVNLVDFSILAYWYKRPLSPEFSIKEKNQLNGDGRVDLIDFSILAYYWTG